MKKTGALLFVLLSATSLTAAPRQYWMAGCGLGSKVLTGQDTLSQIGAVTMNATSGSQFFGIISGTSNCVPDTPAAAQEFQQQTFMANNFASLSQEMAQGDGEALRGLSQLLGCKEEVYPAFAKELQSSQQQIFKAPGAVAALETTKVQLRKNQLLAGECRYII
jgi:hypothetical protein